MPSSYKNLPLKHCLNLNEKTLDLTIETVTLAVAEMFILE